MVNQCRQIYRSEKPRTLTPHRGKFGFDVIEAIDRALIVRCRNETKICLRVLGKDLFDVEYRAIRGITRAYDIRVKLNQASKLPRTEEWVSICGALFTQSFV